MMETLLFRFTLLCLGLSLISVGGAPSILPEMHRQLVDNWGVITDRTFAESLALAQAAPGPNILVISLLGWRVAGLWGLILASIGIILPTTVLAVGAGRVYARLMSAAWFPTFKVGLPPVVLGLLAASGVLTATLSVHNWFGASLTGGAALFAAFSRRNPVIALLSAAALAVLARQFGLIDLSQH